LSYDLLFEFYLEQKLSGFGGVVSILGDPPAKLKTIDYYPVINTHILNVSSIQCRLSARARWAVARGLHEHRGHGNLCMLCMACFLMFKN
jgi:hypothetical protein